MYTIFDKATIFDKLSKIKYGLIPYIFLYINLNMVPNYINMATQNKYGSKYHIYLGRPYLKNHIPYLTKLAYHICHQIWYHQLNMVGVPYLTVKYGVGRTLT